MSPDLFINNLLSPPLLFFVLGAMAGWLKSDLEVPESISRYLSLYLMMAIGMKGGAAMAGTAFSAQMIGLTLTGIAFSFLMPFLAYGCLKYTARLDRPTAAAVAAHYGSISMVTFVTAAAFIRGEGLEYAGYIVAVLALMEAPAILTGLYIAHRAAPETIEAGEKATPKLKREIFTNGAILLLMGAFVIGWLCGDKGLERVSGFLVEPFQGVLCLFLMDMGLLVARQFRSLKDFTLPLIAFGIYMPLIGAALGLAAAATLGVDAGTGMLFMVLCASASYIAVPAAMRLALPQAKASIYVPLSLGITFPFNVAIGIPVYFALAQTIL